MSDYVMNNLSLLDAALRYAEAGYKIFPVKPGLKEPAIKDNLILATTDEATIRDWWKKWPDANIGMPMGKINGIFGIDIDYKDGADINFLKKLTPTPLTSTPTGGHHVFYKYPPKGIKNNLVLEKGVTVRSDGYYFVMPPSIHPNGMPYLEGLVTMDSLMKPTIT